MGIDLATRLEQPAVERVGVQFEYNGNYVIGGSGTMGSFRTFDECDIDETDPANGFVFFIPGRILTSVEVKRLIECNMTAFYALANTRGLSLPDAIIGDPLVTPILPGFAVPVPGVITIIIIGCF